MLGALACRGSLSHVQVWVNPCGARGGADQSHTAIWNGTERKLAWCLMERYLPLRSVSTLLMSRRVNQPQVWPISPWLLVSRCSLLVSSGRSSEDFVLGFGEDRTASTFFSWGLMRPRLTWKPRHFASDRPRGHLRGLVSPALCSSISILRRRSRWSSQCSESINKLSRYAAA